MNVGDKIYASRLPGSIQSSSFVYNNSSTGGSWTLISEFYVAPYSYGYTYMNVNEDGWGWDYVGARALRIENGQWIEKVRAYSDNAGSVTATGYVGAGYIRTERMSSNTSTYVNGYVYRNDIPCVAGHKFYQLLGDLSTTVGSVKLTAYSVNIGLVICP